MPYAVANSSGLKGHQIIGELRQTKENMGIALLVLKGHQIIGELRLARYSLVSMIAIEGSPDHW